MSMPRCGLTRRPTWRRRARCGANTFSYQVRGTEREPSCFRSRTSPDAATSPTSTSFRRSGSARRPMRSGLVPALCRRGRVLDGEPGRADARLAHPNPNGLDQKAGCELIRDSRGEHFDHLVLLRLRNLANARRHRPVVDCVSEPVRSRRPHRECDVVEEGPPLLSLLVVHPMTAENLEAD